MPDDRRARPGGPQKTERRSDAALPPKRGGQMTAASLVCNYFNFSPPASGLNSAKQSEGKSSAILLENQHFSWTATTRTKPCFFCGLHSQGELVDRVPSRAVRGSVAQHEKTSLETPHERRVPVPRARDARDGKSREECGEINRSVHRKPLCSSPLGRSHSCKARPEGVGAPRALVPVFTP